MPAIAAESSKGSHRSKKDAAPSFNVKTALGQLTSISKAWSEADGKANSHLYRLLGTIYEAVNAIGTKGAAIEALRSECAKCKRIKQSKMFKVNERSATDLLIAYALGNYRNDSRRSQWKKTLEIAKRKNVDPSIAAFIEWLNDSGGIEGVITKGKQKAANKAVPFDFDEYASSVDPSVMPRQLQLPPEVDLTSARSFTDDSFFQNFALVLLGRTVDADTASSKFAVIDVVNDRVLLTKAAKAISSQNGKAN
jgi:hypothetical protein